MDWTVERIVMHPRYNATRDEIESRWSITDVQRVHLALDLVEDMDVLRRNRDHDLRPPSPRRRP